MAHGMDEIKQPRHATAFVTQDTAAVRANPKHLLNSLLVRIDRRFEFFSAPRIGDATRNAKLSVRFSARNLGDVSSEDPSIFRLGSPRRNTPTFTPLPADH